MEIAGECNVGNTLKIGNATIKVDDRGLDKHQKALLFIIINREGAGLSIPESLEQFEKRERNGKKLDKSEIDLLAKSYDRSLECAQRITEVQKRQKTIGDLSGIKKPSESPSKSNEKNGESGVETVSD